MAKAGLRAGTAVVDVTPRERALAPRGSFYPRPVNSAHDPLTVRCLVLDDGTRRIVVALVDNCMVHRDLFSAGSK